MKKLVILALAMPILLMACGNTENTNAVSAPTEAATTVAADTPTKAPTLPPAQKDTPTEAPTLPPTQDNTPTEVPPTETPATNTPTPTEAPSSNIELTWTKKTVQITDEDGYVFEYTLRVTPWFLLSNTEYRTQVENYLGSTIPGFEDWNLQKQGNEYRRTIGGTIFHASMNDMYYCVGTVSIKNITNGWDISSDNHRKVYSSIGWIPDEQQLSMPVYTIGRLCYENKDDITTMHSVRICPEMKKNEWGPHYFILMAPEYFTPSNPEGEHYQKMINGTLWFAGSESLIPIGKGQAAGYPIEPIYNGLINKDGEFIPSNE